MKNRNSREPALWLEKADHELIAAKKLLEQDGFGDTIAVHCHQAAEKALKAALLWLGIDYPFVHDLFLLVKLCFEKDSDFKQIQSAAIKLSPLYDQARYPFVDEEPYSDKELMGFVKLADEVLGFVRKKIK